MKSVTSVCVARVTLITQLRSSNTDLRTPRAWPNHCHHSQPATHLLSTLLTQCCHTPSTTTLRSSLLVGPSPSRLHTYTRSQHNDKSTNQQHTTHNTPARLPTMVKQFGNIYLIAAIAVIGGGLFGFDISSMSAM